VGEVKYDVTSTLGRREL